MGVSNDTAAKTFHEHQANGLIVVIQPASLAVHEKVKCPEYEITEIARRPKRGRRCLIRNLKPNFDFHVIKAQNVLQNSS